MKKYFEKQPMIINGVPQKLYFLLETGLNKLTVLSTVESKLGDFAEKYEFVRQATDAMPVFKLKENT